VQARTLLADCQLHLDLAEKYADAREAQEWRELMRGIRVSNLIAPSCSLRLFLEKKKESSEYADAREAHEWRELEFAPLMRSIKVRRGANSLAREAHEWRELMRSIKVRNLIASYQSLRVCLDRGHDA
jgi:hypothetical protein